MGRLRRLPYSRNVSLLMWWRWCCLGLKKLHELDRLLHGIANKDRSVEDHLRYRHGWLRRQPFLSVMTAGKIEKGRLVGRWWTIRDKVLLVSHVQGCSERLAWRRSRLLLLSRRARRASSSERWWGAMMELLHHLWKFGQAWPIESDLGVVEGAFGRSGHPGRRRDGVRWRRRW